MQSEQRHAHILLISVPLVRHLLSPRSFTGLSPSPSSLSLFLQCSCLSHVSSPSSCSSFFFTSHSKRPSSGSLSVNQPHSLPLSSSLLCFAEAVFVAITIDIASAIVVAAIVVHSILVMKEFCISASGGCVSVTPDVDAVAIGVAVVAAIVVVVVNDAGQQRE